MALPEHVQEKRNALVAKVIKDIEAGKPFFWNSEHFGKPAHNIALGAPYRGLNRMRLMIAAEEQGYTDSRWCTYKQAQEKGWQVKKGEFDSQNLLAALADGAIAQSMNGEAIKKMLLAVQNNNSNLEVLTAVDSRGMQIARTIGENAFRGDRPYFKEAMKGTAYTSDVYISGLTNGPCVTIAVPIKDSYGTVLGVLTADISLNSVRSLTEKIKLGSRGYIDVIDPKGTLLAHPDFTRVLNRESLANNSFTQMLMKGECGFMETESTQGILSLVVYTPVEDYRWGIIVYEPIEDVYDALIKSLIYISLFLLIIASLALWAAFATAKSISGPLQRMSLIAGEIAQGNLLSDMPEERVLELEDLRHSFLQMTGSLREIIAKVIGTAESVAIAADTLAAAATEMEKVTETTAIEVQGVASGSKEQAEMARNILANIERMLNNVEETNTAADTVGKTSIQMVNVSKQNIGEIIQAADSMNNAQQTVEKIAERIYSLDEMTKKLEK